jgi:hypothetical protein
MIRKINLTSKFMFQIRNIAIKSTGTPNPSCLKFLPIGKQVTGSASQTIDIGEAIEANKISGLAVNLF